MVTERPVRINTVANAKTLQRLPWARASRNSSRRCSSVKNRVTFGWTTVRL